MAKPDPRTLSDSSYRATPWQDSDGRGGAEGEAAGMMHVPSPNLGPDQTQVQMQWYEPSAVPSQRRQPGRSRLTLEIPPLLDYPSPCTSMHVHWKGLEFGRSRCIYVTAIGGV